LDQAIDEVECFCAWLEDQQSLWGNRQV